MQFNYDHILTLKGISSSVIRIYQKSTGYGKLYHNFKLAEKHLIKDYLPDTVIPINQCNDCDLDKTINNCFVIFQSDFLPTSYIQVIERQTGYVLVNSQWMKKVVLQETNCSEQRIIVLPYLQQFALLDKYKRLPVTSDPDILKFYTIADYKDVKNLQNLFDAFNYAFHGRNDVSLTIKTSNNPLFQRDSKLISKYNPRILILNTMMPQVQIYKLHANNDVYISTAMSVGWQIPPFQAAYFGKPLICGNHSAFTQWVDFNVVTTLDSYEKVIPLRQYSGGRFKPRQGNGWKVNMIEVDQIISKLKYVYDNYNQLRSRAMDLSRFDVSNINAFLK